MTENKRQALRGRQYTFYEMVVWAQFYHEHRNENSPEQLLTEFLKWKPNAKAETMQAHQLLLIESAVADYYKLPLQDVRGKRRYKEFVRARQVIAHLAVQFGSEHEVANTLGPKRDNIHFSKTKCRILMQSEPLLRKEVADIEARLCEPLAAIEKKQFENETNNKNEDDTIEQHEQQPADRG